MDCKEYAEDPGILFDKLNDWGHEVIVIPHGTSWGTYTPDESDWKDQLNDDFHDQIYKILLKFILVMEIQKI